MGIKKRVTMTVSVEIDIELSDDLENPTPELIKDINACGYNIETGDDLYVAAAKLVLNGGQGSAWDVFGLVTPLWTKILSDIPNESTFFERVDLYVEDFEVTGVK